MSFYKWVILVFAFMSTNVSSSPQKEIDHLLQFVSITSCQYERNGTFHNGSEAVEHINKKYNYFKSKIDTAEDFIKYSATKSKMSGNYYRIHCNSHKPVNSQDWLLTELNNYRSTNN